MAVFEVLADALLGASLAVIIISLWLRRQYAELHEPAKRLLWIGIVLFILASVGGVQDYLRGFVDGWNGTPPKP